jgi:hypothetical protein
MTVAVDKVELSEDNPIRSYGVETKKQSEIELQPLTSSNGSGDGDEFEDEGLEKHHHDAEAYTHPIHEARPWNLQDWLYPPDLPRSCQLLRRENIAIPACYLLVGLLQGLSGPLINVYPLDLGATEAQQVTLSSIRSLPASFKLVFGFLSDNFPIAGYRRKSYMMLGWCFAAGSMLPTLRYKKYLIKPASYKPSLPTMHRPFPFSV